MPEKPTYEELEQRVRELEKAESERRRSEERNRKTSELLALFLKHSPIYAFLKEVGAQESRTLFASDNYVDMIGIPASEMIGKSMDELFPAEFAEKITRDDIDVVSRGENLRIEEEFNGRKYVTYKFPIVQDEKKYLAGYTIDITDQKRTEEALRESERKWRNILVETPQIGISLDPQASIVFANQRLLELTGWKEEEVIGRDWFDLFIPEDVREEVRRVFDKVIDSRSSLGFSTYENEILTRSGKRLNVAWSNVITNDPRGGVEDVTCMGIDLTERIRAEERLEEERQRLANIIWGTNVGTWEWNVQTGETRLNERWAEIVGYTLEELEPVSVETWLKFVNPADLGRSNDVLQKHFDGELEIYECDTRLRHKDGHWVWVLDRGRLVSRTPDGKPQWMYGTHLDITEKKEADEEREKLQAQLTQAKKMEAIGTLAGGIAHNFNNILMVIQGRASLMMLDKDPAHPDYEHLKGIEEYVGNAVELTRALLGFARGGKYEVKVTDLNDLVKRQSNMFGRTRKEIRVHGKYEQDLWKAQVDRGQIEQAMLNLFVNAWQAMPGGGDLFVQTENVALFEEDIKLFNVSQGRYVKVAVTDTGVGMDAATREKIFEPFFSTKDIGRGSGLGLASLYGIVKNHGGFIKVYSEKGEGTTFAIYLPASDEDASIKSAEPERNEIDYGHGTVLLVDDEKMIVEVGKEMIEKLGYRTLTAVSGQEAVDLYVKRRKEIDLVILDMIMPGMGGGETYDRLREADEDVRVLLASGYSINGKAKEIMDRGCCGFIQKPFSLNDLSTKIKQALESDSFQ